VNAFDSGVSGNIMSQYLLDKDSDIQALLGKLSPFFSPPLEFKDKFGDYRSPLNFYNRQDVRTTSKWAKRREEILDRWNKIMSNWPPFIKDQKMKIVGTSKKESITIFRIWFYWLPGEKIEGYLLIPERNGKKPCSNHSLLRT
jgi:hypothetical protein